MVVPIVSPYAKKRHNNSATSTNVGYINTQNTVNNTVIQQQTNCRSQQPSNCCTTNNDNSNSNTVLVVTAPVANTAGDSVDNHENCQNHQNCGPSTVATNIGTIGMQSQKRNGQREKKRT